MRRTVWLLLCLFGMPSFLWAATAHVKADQVRDVDGNATVTLAFTGGITNTGDTVTGAIWWKPTTSNLTSVTVCGNSATLLDNPTTMGTTLSGATFVYPNVSSGACTVSATFDANVTDARLVIVEASGVDTTTPVGTSHVGNTQLNQASGTDVVTSTAITPPDNGRIIYGFTSNNAGGCIPSAGTGFTMTSVNIQTRSAEYLVQSTAGSQAATFSSTCTESWITFAVALKDASAGGSTPTFFQRRLQQ